MSIEKTNDFIYEQNNEQQNKYRTKQKPLSAKLQDPDLGHAYT